MSGEIGGRRSASASEIAAAAKRLHLPERGSSRRKVAALRARRSTFPDAWWRTSATSGAFAGGRGMHFERIPAGLFDDPRRERLRLSGGDDYELVFTAAPSTPGDRGASRNGRALTAIGSIQKGARSCRCWTPRASRCDQSASTTSRDRVAPTPLSRFPSGHLVALGFGAAPRRARAGRSVRSSLGGGWWLSVRKQSLCYDDCRFFCDRNMGLQAYRRHSAFTNTRMVWDKWSRFCWSGHRARRLVLAGSSLYSVRAFDIANRRRSAVRGPLRGGFGVLRRRSQRDIRAVLQS